MSEPIELKSEHGVLQAQLEGPNTPFVPLGECYELDGLTEPEGEATPDFCRDFENPGELRVKDITMGTGSLCIVI